jgi:hypothetical protein
LNSEHYGLDTEERGSTIAGSETKMKNQTGLTRIKPVKKKQKMKNQISRKFVLIEPII